MPRLVPCVVGTTTNPWETQVLTRSRRRTDRGCPKPARKARSAWRRQGAPRNQACGRHDSRLRSQPRRILSICSTCHCSCIAWNRFTTRTFSLIAQRGVTAKSGALVRPEHPPTAQGGGKEKRAMTASDQTHGLPGRSYSVRRLPRRVVPGARASVAPRGHCPCGGSNQAHARTHPRHRRCPGRVRAPGRETRTTRLVR